ncbi:MAG: leucine-rich repeat domain-containing protein [Clostridia bacterium]|nr:leucine-rich repeat domain-containing protein [Clostridia bacterium]
MESRSFTSRDFACQRLADGTVRIMMYKGSDETLRVPDRIDGTAVTQLGNGVFAMNKRLTEITLPEGITRAGSDTFRRCRVLTSVTLPRSLTVMGSMAMADCEALTSVALPPAMTVLAPEFFSGCSALVQVTLPRALQAVSHHAFFRCAALKDIALPDSLRSIGTSAFSGCKALTELFVPAGVTSIGRDAFEGCDALTLSGEEGSAIQQYCQENGLPFRVDAAPAADPVIPAFPPDPDTPVTQPGADGPRSDGVFSWETGGDGGLVLTGYNGTDPEVTVTAPAGARVTAVGAQAFQGKDVRRVVLPEGVRRIGPEAFAFCISLQEIVLPATLEEIGEKAFGGDMALSRADLPEGLQAIGDSAFLLCEELALTIPRSVTRFGDQICLSLQGKHPVRVYPGSAGERYCVEHKLPFVLQEAEPPREAPALPDPEPVPEEVPPAPPRQTGSTAGDFAVTELKDDTLRIRRYKGREEQLMVPGSLKGKPLSQIGNGAFYGNNRIVCVLLPSGITQLCTDAFGRCSALTDLNIPGTVTEIGSGCFQGCTALTELDLPDGLLRIGNEAFKDCTALTSLTLPAGLRGIGVDAFKNCPNLTVQVHPDSLGERYCQEHNIPCRVV